MTYKSFFSRVENKLKNSLSHSDFINRSKQVEELETLVHNQQSQINVLRAQISEQEFRLVKYMHPDKYEEWLEDKFRQLYGKELDFDNPKTFNEKIQWIKLYGADKQQTELADKYLVKKYIKNTIGEEYVIPLIGVYDNFKEIDFGKLPNSFVIKVNNGSQSNIIVKDKSSLDINDAEAKINHHLTHNLFAYGLEMHYKNIIPKIIIEEYIEFQDGIEDYKFYCFNGSPEYLLVIADRFTNEKMSFYDMEFTKQEFSILDGMGDLNIEKPQQFDEMLKLTKFLANKLKYPFIRIDWYIDKKGKLYFGEFTFNPGAGWYFFKPEKYNKEWGDKITLSKKRNEIP